MDFLELKSGQSVEADKILAYKSKIDTEKYIYLLGGVHGDEVEGVYVLDKLIDWLKQTDLDLALVVIPILNVDGYRAGSRVNSHGVDLNRNLPTNDWSPKYDEDQYFPGPSALSEPENVFLNDLMNKFHPSIILSFHSWKPMLNYNGDCKDVAQFLAKYNHYSVVDNIGYPTPGSLGTYGPEKFQCPVLTLEFPKIKKNKSLADISNENLQGLQELLQSDLIKKY